MKLTKYLGNLGYGTRREVTQLLARKRVTGQDGVALWPDSAFQHHELRVDGEVLDPALGVVVMLNKPVAYVCSTRDVPPLIYELLPPRFLRRTPLIAPIGRLDRETTGLLLLTDNGDLNHRLTSPKSRQPKTYRVQLASDLRGDEAEQFASGTLMLTSETVPLVPATLEVIAPRDVNITVIEGRYHQVRRMFAAVGNHVIALHRSAVGMQTLGNLASGSWRTLTDDEIAALRS